MSEQDGTGLEQGGSDDASRQSKQSAQLGCCLARGSWTHRNVYQGRTNPILYKKGFGFVFVYRRFCGACTHVRRKMAKFHYIGGVLSLESMVYSAWPSKSEFEELIDWTNQNFIKNLVH